MVKKYITKDSGKRVSFGSGMVRDTDTSKPRFDLIIPDFLPYTETMLYRFAQLMARGAEKYGEKNWQLANSTEELTRFKSSALRHMLQWVSGESDEDHASAVYYNIMAYEAIRYKLENDKL